MLWASGALALGPHELLVLVNGNSSESVRIADTFVKLRDVPAVNVVRLDLPDTFSESVEGITPAQFTEHIWRPANSAIAGRGIGDHILAWVYSTKFPVLVRSNPEVSIQGMTFARNYLPASDLIRRGRYLSPLFTGPFGKDAPGHYPQSFDALKRWLGDEMPLPSMMLGVTGKNGNSEGSVIACLMRGAESDGGAPTGTVWFVKSGSTRSTPREWQFPRAVAELRKLDVRAEVVGSIAGGTGDVLGITMGARNVEPEVWSYRPGSMAEHLTSFGAVFSDHNQTRLTAWIDSGVTASAGAVTEPFATWSKFPSACFYVHYARGCCMMESFFQAIACPMQLLLVGEPLASPWKPDAEMVIGHPADGATLSGLVEIRPSVQSATAGDRYRRFVLLVDGRTQAEGRVLEVDTTTIPDGEHVFRVVGYGTGLVRNQVFKTVRVNIRNGHEETAK